MRLGAGSNVGRVVTWLLQRAVRIGRPMPRSLFHVLLLQLHPPTCKMHFLKKSSICFFRLKLHYSFWNNNKLLFVWPCYYTTIGEKWVVLFYDVLINFGVQMNSVTKLTLLWNEDLIMFSCWKIVNTLM